MVQASIINGVLPSPGCLAESLAEFGKREDGTARLEAAIATRDAGLMVAATVWPCERVQLARSRCDQVRLEIKRRAQ